MNSKRIRMFLSLVCVLALALSTPSVLFADDDDGDGRRYGKRGCKLEGTWIWDFEKGKWLTTFNGTGNKGTMVMDYIGGVMEWCPGCYWSSYRGVWEKSGRKTYDWTFQGYLVDGDGLVTGVPGSVIAVPLNHGTITLTECNTAELYNEATVFWYGTEIIAWAFEGQGVMQRLLLHQPFPIQTIPEQ